MPSVNNQIPCLHITELIGDNKVELIWSSVENAAKYELEACFDRSFGDHTSTGKSWLSFETGDKTWAQIGTYVVDWEEIECVPESHAIYIGSGIETPSPEFGLGWSQIFALTEIWVTRDAKLLTWAELAMLYTKGHRWSSLDAKHMDFDQIELMGQSWDVLENEDPDIALHLKCNVNIPKNARHVVFRIRVRDAAGNILSTLQTAQKPIITSRIMEIPPLIIPETILTEGRKAEMKSDVRYKLRYNGSLLENILLKRQRRFNPEQTVELWSGLTAAGQVMSKTKKTAELQLDWHKVI